MEGTRQTTASGNSQTPRPQPGKGCTRSVDLLCPDCLGELSGEQELMCTGCAARFPVVDGIPCMAPVGPEDIEDYHPHFFEQLAQVESGNFWFEYRNQVVTDAMARHKLGEGSYLEVGCGTGFVLVGSS